LWDFASGDSLKDYQHEVENTYNIDISDIEDGFLVRSLKESVKIKILANNGNQGELEKHCLARNSSMQ
jgi:hypothetical protein